MNIKKSYIKKLERKYNNFMLSSSDDEKLDNASDLVEVLSNIVNGDLLDKVEYENKNYGKFDKRLFLEDLYIEVE